MPKLPVPSFSKSVYWLAGLLLGIGYGSDGRSFFSGLEVSGDERTSVGFCWEPEDLLEIRDRFKRVGEGMIKVEGKTSGGKASSSLLGTEAPLHVCVPRMINSSINNVSPEVIINSTKSVSTHHDRRPPSDYWLQLELRLEEVVLCVVATDTELATRLSWVVSIRDRKGSRRFGLEAWGRKIRRPRCGQSAGCCPWVARRSNGNLVGAASYLS